MLIWTNDCETSGCLGVDLELDVFDEWVRFLLLRSGSLCPCAISHAKCPALYSVLESVFAERCFRTDTIENTTVAVFYCSSHMLYRSSPQLHVAGGA